MNAAEHRGPIPWNEPIEPMWVTNRRWDHTCDGCGGPIPRGTPHWIVDNGRRMELLHDGCSPTWTPRLVVDNDPTSREVRSHDRPRQLALPLLTAVEDEP